MAECPLTPASKIALMNDKARFGQVADDRLDGIVAENADRNLEFMKLYFDNARFRRRSRKRPGGAPTGSSPIRHPRRRGCAPRWHETGGKCEVFQHLRAMRAEAPLHAAARATAAEGP
jgi:hypothetical protein